MLSHPVRFSKLRTFVLVFAVLAIIAGAALIGQGVDAVLRSDQPRSMLIPAVAYGLAMITAAVVGLAFTWLLLKIESHSNRQYNQMIELCELIRRHGDILSSIAQSSRISEGTKSITARAEEREAVRSAIREEVAREDWEAALYLVDQMEHRFGYQDEADRLRTQIVEARTADMRDRLNEALGRIEEHWGAYEWERASQEIERLMRVLPDDKHTKRLPEEHQKRREARKAELLAAWSEAVNQTGLEEDIDVDRAIRILKELDSYLTREEARRLEQSARGVFKAKLVQFGMQFEYAVRDHRWRDALEIGIQIVDEFPNSRMASEVRNMESVLRQRAGLSGDVEVTARPTPSSPA